MPKLTIGLPVYNGEKYLTKALESILAQTFTDFEVIIVDNASTDSTEKIVRQFLTRDSRLTYIRNQADMNLVYSWFKLVYGSNAEYFTMFHCDLLWAPTYAEECITQLEADPQTILTYSYCQWLDNNGQKLEITKDTANFAVDNPGERFLNVLKGLAWCTAFHGFSRREPLALVFLRLMFNGYGNNAGNDNEILASLALQGKLVQVEKPLLLRHQDNTQAAGAEKLSERYNRLYCDRKNYHFFRGPRIYLPFLNFIRDHCFDLLDGNFPPDELDRLTKETVSALLNRYKTNINYEVKHLIELVLTGDFKRNWGEDEDQPPQAETPLGKYRYIDLTYLLYVQQNLEYVNAFLPKFPQLHLARALVLLQLGRQKEALLALDTELEHNIHDRKALELKNRLSEKTNSPQK